MKPTIIHYNNRSDNSMAIRPFQCRSTQFLNSFFPRTTSQWNSLPMSVVSKNFTISFKHSITNLIHVLLLAKGYSCIVCKYTEIIIDRWIILVHFEPKHTTFSNKTSYSKIINIKSKVYIYTAAGQTFV